MNILPAINLFIPLDDVIDFGAELLNLPDELKGAAKMVVGGLAFDPSMQLEGAADLGRALCEDVFRALGGEPRTELWEPRPRDGGCAADDGYARCVRTSGAPERSGVDPAQAAYARALRTLEANWATFDTAAGFPMRDGLVGMPDFRAIAHNPNASSELKEAARFFVDNPEYFNRADTAGPVLFSDRLISIFDVKAELARLPEDCGRDIPIDDTGRPRGPRSAEADAPSPGSDLSAILSDPSISLEEKVQMVLAALNDRVDDDIEGVLAEMDAIGKEKLEIDGSTKEGKAALQQAETDEKHLELRLQRLMQKRTAMHDLRSSMSAQFHEATMVAIRNLGKA